MPGTMIRKVAIAQAFREAFPFAVEGMYTPEEMPDEQGQEPVPAANQLKPVFTEADAPAPEQQPDPEPEFTPDPEPVYVDAAQDGMLAAAVRKAETETETDVDPNLFEA